MTTYRIAAPDGKTYKIDGPAGATQEEIKAEVIRQNPHLAAPVTPSEIPAARKERGFIESLGAPIQALSEGVIKGGGNIMFGGQQLVGKGLQAVGATQTGQSLIEDALRRQAESQGRVAPFKQEYPVSTGIGELGAEAVITAPVGGMIARPLAAVAKYAPAVAPYVTPVVNALRSSGFSSGIPVAKGVPLATRAADIGARVIGGGVTGGATAALTNPEEMGTGAGVGAPKGAAAAKRGED